MKKVVKWIGIVLGGLFVVVVIAAIGLSVAGNARLNKTVDIQAESLQIPTETAALDRGEHLAKAACMSCHGADLSGDPSLMIQRLAPSMRPISQGWANLIVTRNWYWPSATLSDTGDAS